VDLPPAWATNFVEDGATTLGLGDKNSFGAMKYNVYISTPYPFATKYAGRADILQLINRTAANGVSFYTTSNQFYLDTEPFYTTHARGQNRVKPILPGSHLQFSDGPSYEEDYSSSQEAFLTSIVDQFEDYIMFRTDNGHQDKNIYVPIGEITWSWSASSQFGTPTFPNSWSPPFYAVARPTTNSACIKIPQWSHIWP
jgi:hypothetical protein